jgi:hypothetical protein
VRSFFSSLAVAAIVTSPACSSSRAAPQAPPVVAAAAPAPAPPPPRKEDPDPGWPRTIVDSEGWRVTAYQPQVERWVGNELRARLAAVVVPNGAGAQYAAVTVRARASVDKRPRVVTLEGVTVDGAQFAAPALVPQGTDTALARNLPALLGSMALDRLTVELADEQARPDDGVCALRDEPPRILVTQKLAVLVPIDGEPVWRRANSRYDRVINTRALVLSDRARHWLYVYVGDTWYRARTLRGEWRTATLLPFGIEQLRAQLSASHAVDLVDAPGSPLSRALYVGRVPHIIVSTEPTALVQLEGAPALEPIEGTHLSAAVNSDDDLFSDSSDGSFYVLLSGRWFRARSLDGPWQFVPPAELPRDFARIPPEHKRARVMAAVPGTPLAAEALVANEVAETATVRITGAKLKVQYDGPPRFAAIEGTELRWALNSPTPVIEVSKPPDGLYYALADGVWFNGPRPDGPWTVSTAVPPLIYQIPARSPLHFVTAVRVYGATGDAVRVGYTPGYFGACLTGSGTFVWGTGWKHAPWIGSTWIGRPATYGFGARWEPGLGWTLGGDAGSARATYRPWWPPIYGAVAGKDAEAFADERVDLYARWGDAVAPRIQPTAPFEIAGGGDDLYAGSDGQVYRSLGARWERRTVDGWQAVSGGTLQAAATPGAVRDQLRALDRTREARRDGDARWELFRVTTNAVP